MEQVVNGADVLALFHRKYWDLVVLDGMFPNLDGIKVCQEIRKTSQVPVIMLTALDNENDRIRGFETGADDCLSKPYNPRELVARIKAIFRRVPLAHSLEKNKLNYSGVKIDLLTRTVTANNNCKINLTPKEFDLIALLSRNAGQVFTRELLLEEIWGLDHYGDARNVDTLIKRLREKLKSLDIPCKITTVWGVGYKFEVK